MSKKTIKDVDISGKRIFIRVDFNVPIKNGKIEDDTRIAGIVPTIEYAIGKVPRSFSHRTSAVRSKTKRRPKKAGTIRPGQVQS